MNIIKSFVIDDFGVSNAFSLIGANSGQTSIKCRDLACNVESLPLNNCRDLTVKLEVKYIFPTSSSGLIFYVYELPEMRKYQRMVLGCERIYNPGRKFFRSSRIFMELCGSKIQLAFLHGSFISGVTNPEIVY